MAGKGVSSSSACFMEGDGKVKVEDQADVNIVARGDPASRGHHENKARFMIGKGEAEVGGKAKVNISAGNDDEEILDFAAFLKGPEVNLQIKWSEAKALVGELRNSFGFNRVCHLKDADLEDLDKLKKVKTITGMDLKQFLNFVKKQKESKMNVTS